MEIESVNISPELSAWIVLACVLIYGLIHSLLASLKAKAVARRLFGRLADRGYRIVFNLLAILTFLPILALPAILPDMHLYSISYPWAVLTVAIQGLAILLLAVGLFQTGLWTFLGVRNIVDHTSNDQSEMVVCGLYRWVRHPLYTAGLLFIWLIPVMTLNLFALNIGLSIYLILGAIIEERKLVSDFGQPYILYRRHTPMLFPVKISRTNFKDRV
jgi:protein-S-isoprenylcysteine O-methyltransferase Ste14